MNRLLGSLSRWLPWVLVASMLLVGAVAGLDQPRPNGVHPEVSGSVEDPTLDSDGDDLLDSEEVSGWPTAAGKTYVTDPLNADTDGDGLADGEEAGSIDVVPTQGSVYAGITDPTTADSDEDVLDDASELDGDFNPWAADSDSDGLDDMAEIEFGSDPLTPDVDGDHLDDSEELENGSDPNTFDLTTAQASGAFLGGAFAGDSEWLARHVGRLNSEQLESWQYLTGEIAGGFVAVGDVRDIASNLGTREWAAALLSLAAIVPVLGDGAKVSTSAVGFAKRGGAATRAALYFVARSRALSSAAKSRAIRTIIRLGPAKARLAQDVKVLGSPAPAALSTLRPIGRNSVQNARKDDLVAEIQDKGYTDIRVNQQQINADGLRVGINRPDIQATRPDGTREYWELDTSISSRGPMHESRILSNDDDGVVCLLSERSEYVTCGA